MTGTEDIERSIAELRISPGAAADQRILADACSALDMSTKDRRDAKPSLPGIWRTIMKNKWTKFSAAAVIVAVAVAAIVSLDRSTTEAYAIEQTIKANHTIQYLHIKDFAPGIAEPKQFWMQFDKSGELLHARMDFPKTEDGPKVVVWTSNKAEVWFKAKKSHLIINDKAVATKLRELAEDVDPKSLVQRLCTLQTQGKMTLDIRQPAGKGDHATVTATYLPKSPSPGKRLVLRIDGETKLVSEMEIYHRSDKEYVLAGRMTFHGYNQPIDPKQFVLTFPKNEQIVHVDQATKEVGLPQQKLTDKQIAVKVAREFFEALIAEDYAKAGNLMGGMPADAMAKLFEKLHVTRIISIGAPEPHEMTKSLRVPCEIEVERDGATSVWRPRPLVRPVYGQPGRWTIIGGV